MIIWEKKIQMNSILDYTMSITLLFSFLVSEKEKFIWADYLYTVTDNSVTDYHVYGTVNQHNTLAH